MIKFVLELHLSNELVYSQSFSFPGHVICVVVSIDGMTAKYYPIPYEVLTDISTTITNNVPGINRVVYDVTSKPPSTIE